MLSTSNNCFTAKIKANWCRDMAQSLKRPIPKQMIRIALWSTSFCEVVINTFNFAKASVKYSDEVRSEIVSLTRLFQNEKYIPRIWLMNRLNLIENTYLIKWSSASFPCWIESIDIIGFDFCLFIPLCLRRDLTRTNESSHNLFVSAIWILFAWGKKKNANIRFSGGSCRLI